MDGYDGELWTLTYGFDVEAVVCAELQRDGGGELGEQPGVVPGQGHRLRAVVTLLAHSHLHQGHTMELVFL